MKAQPEDSGVGIFWRVTCQIRRDRDYPGASGDFSVLAPRE